MKKLMFVFIAVTALPAQDMIELDFQSLEAIAMKSLREIQPRSIADDTEYCGWVLWRDEKLFASSIAKGTKDSCDLPNTPAGSVAVASFHTHGAHDPDYWSEVPSEDDMLGDFEDEVYGFVGTPGGRVWLIDPDQEAVFVLCGEGCIQTDPQFDARDYDAIPNQFKPDELIEYLDN